MPPLNNTESSALKIMKDLNVEVQVGRHMDCHNRFKSKAAWRELEEKIEHARVKLEALEHKQYLFMPLFPTWNETWKKRHENVMMHFINKWLRMVKFLPCDSRH